MHLQILTGAQLAQNPTLQTAVHKHRYKVFVDKLGWTALANPSGLESDAFDTPSAIHFLVLPHHSSTKVIAYTRLLPTTLPHLLSHVYPSLLHGALSKMPIGETTYEWTRCTALYMNSGPDTADFDIPGTPFAMPPHSRVLYLGVLEWAFAAGLERLSFQGEERFALLVRAFGGDAEVLADTSWTSEGEAIVPVVMGVGESIVGGMRRAFGLEGEVVRARL